MNRRVVITGLGMVTPLGCGVDVTWRNLLAGVSGARLIEHFDVSDLATRYACQIPRSGPGSYNPDDWLEPREQKRVDAFIAFGLAAAEQAVQDAGWSPTSETEKIRTGVMIGSGIGGLASIADTALLLNDRGPRRVSPFFIPGALINLISGQVSIRYDCRGPNHAVATACATGAHAIGDAARLIRHDQADVMIAGGSESPICRIGIAGFNACKALSTRYHETPERASRPYDRDRDGFVMGEGAGVVVLESLEHAKARGARPYAELVGYGLSGDASHITAPAPDGRGGLQSMQAALAQSGRSAAALDYINAHGTSTMADPIELEAIAKMCGGDCGSVSISSSKSATGHLLGAAGAIEAIFCTLAIRDQVVPPTINLDNPVVGAAFDLVPGVARQREVSLVMSNSFGFGGSNASLVMAAL